MLSFLTLRNCIIAGNGRFGSYEGHNQGDTVASHCCYYGNGVANFHDFEYDGVISRSILLVADTTAEINSIAGNSNNIAANPGFSNLASNWDFNQFYSDSPCLDAGEGNCDIGAYENPPLVAPSNATYYVNEATGDDSRSAPTAQDPATPWKTIAHAASVAGAGDTVVIAPGTYTQKVYITKGGSIGPVTYRAAGDVRVDGRMAAGNEWGFHLDRVANVMLEGFEILNFTNGGCRLSSSPGNTIQNTTIFSNGSCGVYFYRSSRNALVGLECYKNGTAGKGVFFRSEHTEAGSGGVTLDRCRIHDEDYGVYAYVTAVASFFRNCNIYNNRRMGIYARDTRGFTVENCVLWGHTINEGYAIQIALGSAVTLVRNSVIANNKYGLMEGHTQGDFWSVYNCFWSNTTAHYYDADTGQNLTNVSQINQLSDVISSNNVSVAPMFENPAVGDFRIRLDSGCLDAGSPTPTHTSYRHYRGRDIWESWINPVNVWTNTLTEDIFGGQRKYGLAVDIGSHEHPPPRGIVLGTR